MDKRALVPSVVLAVAIMAIFSAAAFSGDWFRDYNAEELHPQEFAPGPDGLSKDSINYMLFEEFGPILIVLALLMFGSIIGGVYIAKEDEEEETEEDNR
ncbi:MAG: hypothetical protein FWD81_00140 [Methanomassiliicoccaceae archaeon]|nr:hypothetical protein [Methanomassiliicoccaceae archaeon]